MNATNLTAIAITVPEELKQKIKVTSVTVIGRLPVERHVGYAVVMDKCSSDHKTMKQLVTVELKQKNKGHLITNKKTEGHRHIAEMKRTYEEEIFSTI